METAVETQSRFETPPPGVFEDRLLSHGTPSRRLLGLPIARLIPQDLHSVLDYLGGLGTTALGLLARATAARVSAATLGLGTVVASLLTDYRMSALKLIPIEAHEVLDYAAGLASVASPYLFRYRKREPLVSAVQIASGAATVLIALFTDYRAYCGRRFALRQ